MLFDDESAALVGDRIGTGALMEEKLPALMSYFYTFMPSKELYRVVNPKALRS
jgi:hypothetical protein